MMMKSLFAAVLLASGLSLNAETARYRALEMAEIDMETFSLLRKELQSAKKVFEDLRDSQNPGAMKSAVGSLGGVMKELAYISSALILVCGFEVGVLIAFNVNPLEFLRNQFGAGLLVASVPVVGFPVILTYAFLKILFGKILASSNQDAKNIKESLTQIEQIINKLDYEIKKVENVIRFQKASKTTVR